MPLLDKNSAQLKIQKVLLFYLSTGDPLILFGEIPNIIFNLKKSSVSTLLVS